MISLILQLLYKIAYICFSHKFYTVLCQFLETETSDRCLICIVQRLRFSGFILYPLSFFLYSPFKQVDLLYRGEPWSFNYIWFVNINKKDKLDSNKINKKCQIWFINSGGYLLLSTEKLKFWVKIVNVVINSRSKKKVLWLVNHEKFCRK